MPLHTLDSGNLAGLFKLAELEAVAYESTKILSQYAKAGGQMELTPEEFKTRFKLLLPEFVPPSVGGKVIDSGTVIEVTRGLEHF